MMLFGGRSGKLKDSCCSSDIQEANARNHIQKRSYNPWGKSTESETNLEVVRLIYFLRINEPAGPHLHGSEASPIPTVLYKIRRRMDWIYWLSMDVSAAT